MTESSSIFILYKHYANNRPEPIYIFRNLQELSNFNVECDEHGNITSETPPFEINPLQNTINLENSYFIAKDDNQYRLNGQPHHDCFSFYRLLRHMITLDTEEHRLSHNFKTVQRVYNQRLNQHTCTRCRQPKSFNHFSENIDYCLDCKPNTVFFGLFHDKDLIYAFKNIYSVCEYFNQIEPASLLRIIRPAWRIPRRHPACTYKLPNGFHLQFNITGDQYVSRGKFGPKSEFASKMKSAVYDNNTIHLAEIRPLARQFQMCNSCNQIKPFSDKFFRKQNNGKSSYHTLALRCRICTTKPLCRYGLFDYRNLIWVFKSHKALPSTAMKDEDEEYTLNWRGTDRYSIRQISEQDFKNFGKNDLLHTRICHALDNNQQLPYIEPQTQQCNVCNLVKHKSDFRERYRTCKHCVYLKNETRKSVSCPLCNEKKPKNAEVCKKCRVKCIKCGKGTPLINPVCVKCT